MAIFVLVEGLGFTKKTEKEERGGLSKENTKGE